VSNACCHVASSITEVQDYLSQLFFVGVGFLVTADDCRPPPVLGGSENVIYFSPLSNRSNRSAASSTMADNELVLKITSRVFPPR